MAVSLKLSCLFPTLLQLCSKGEGLGSSFLRGRIRAVSCQKLELLGCGGGWRGLGAATRALPEDPTGLGTQCGCQECRSWYWGCPQYQSSFGHGSVPSKVGPLRASFLCELAV